MNLGLKKLRYIRLFLNWIFHLKLDFCFREKKVMIITQTDVFGSNKQTTTKLTSLNLQDYLQSKIIGKFINFYKVSSTKTFFLFQNNFIFEMIFSFGKNLRKKTDHFFLVDIYVCNGLFDEYFSLSSLKDIRFLFGNFCFWCYFHHRLMFINLLFACLFLFNGLPKFFLSLF